jgi:alpha-galactosidase
MELLEEGAGAIRFQQSEMPMARYTSGLAIYEEGLVGGRWIGRYWSGTGFVEPERNLSWLEKAAFTPQQTAGLDLAAFGLEVSGQSLHFGWEVVDMRVEPALRENYHAIVQLRSRIMPVQVQVHTFTDNTGIFVRRLDITNHGTEPLALGAVWPWSGLLFRPLSTVHLNADPVPQSLIQAESAAFSVGYMTERVWGNEGAFRWLPLPSTPVRLEGRNGRSGHGTPFFVVRDELTGEYVIGALAWSGNWVIELTAEQLTHRDPMLAFRIGPTNPSPQRVIEPGETVQTPQVHLGRLQLDFDGIIQTWHRHLRQSVLLPEVPGREGLVILNHWGYMAHEMSEARLFYEVDVAAEIGAEVFVVDAGWFGNQGTQWWTTVGDWQAGDRLPNGLEPVFAYARQKGLLCGLWLDLERLGSESQTAKSHPEWLLKRYGQTTLGGDMDLTNPIAVEHLEQTLVRIIERYELELFRLDYNTMVYEGGQTSRHGYEENTAWRYYEHVYAMYERIRARFPRLIMENCSGGGGRTDLGMVSHFHHTWVTDWQIAPRTLSIVNGMTMALPPERIDRNCGTGQDAQLRGDLDFQLRSCMFGHMTLTGLSAGPGEANAAQIERIRHHVRLYKEFIRPLLATCAVYHHTPELVGKEPAGWAVLEYVAADSRRAVVGLFRLAGKGADAYHLRLRGLRPGQHYRVTFENRAESVRMGWADLHQVGLTIRLARPLTSELILIEAIEDQ